MSKKHKERLINGLLAMWFLFVTANSYAAALENLDEVIARKWRLPNATWGRSVLEGVPPAYYWQPETLYYNDITTGNEVWRFTYGPYGKNFTQDIQVPIGVRMEVKLLFPQTEPMLLNRKQRVMTIHGSWQILMVQGCDLVINCHAATGTGQSIRHGIPL